MVVDISAHLRRLVLAGLPLLGPACLPEEGLVAADGGAPELYECMPRSIYDVPDQSGGGRMINIGFDRTDLRWKDLFAACTQQAMSCGRLCTEILVAAKPMGYSGAGIFTCELGCDSEGGAVATIKYSTAVPGRRPEGFTGGVASGPGTRLADFWAGCAMLEGVSIAAFAVLEADLRRHAAPATLIARARHARRDEGRHFRLMRRLAQECGARPIRLPRTTAVPARTLEEVAMENAIEGCVGETFSAAVALWQGATARQLSVRRTMSGIAADEIAHAELAWAVDVWARDRLGPPARRRLDQARARAGEMLVNASTAPVDPTLVREAGLPDRTAAAGIAAVAHATLWG
jgi:hypothetical protein